jgi:hypothetical protein
MTEGRGTDRRAIDLDETARLVEALESDLERLKSGRGGVEQLRADVERLRAALASPQSHEVLHGGLTRLREKLHVAGDELLTDAIRTGDYIARIGRLLGM